MRIANSVENMQVFCAWSSFIDVREVAHAVLFLALNGAVNGSAQRVEGGIVRSIEKFSGVFNALVDQSRTVRFALATLYFHSHFSVITISVVRALGKLPMDGLT